jgi:hypothetical protein
VTAAAKAIRERASASGWDTSSVEPFHQWCSEQGDPFLDAYVELRFERNEETGRLERDEKGANRLALLAPEAIERFTVRQDQALKHLVSVVHEVDPLPLLTGMIFLDRLTPWGAYYEPHSVPTALDLEIVAAIIAGSSGSRRPATAEDLRSTATAARSLRWWAHALGLAHAHADARGSLEAEIRHRQLRRWLVLRGSAYTVHAQAVARSLDHGGAVRARLGVSVDGLISVSDAIYRQWEQRVTSAVDGAWKEAGLITGQSPASSAEATEEYLTAFAGAAMRLLPSALCVPVHRDKQAEGDEELSRVIHALGIRRGEADRVTSVLVDPPQRIKPFLILSPPLEDAHFATDEVALLVQQSALTTDLHLTIDGLLSAGSTSWPAARARAVDRHAVSLLARALPGSRAVSNVFIETPSGRAEVDGVIVYDDTAIVVEGKGATLKTAARRGGVERLTAQLRDLVSDGYRQLERDHDYVLTGRPARFFDERGQTVLEVDGSRIRRCYQLMPTLDDLGDFGTSLPDLVDLEVLPDGAVPWIVALTELHVVADTLARPAQFIGYLEFRARWAGDRRLFVPDEYEMLSLYLRQVDLPNNLARVADGGFVIHELTQSTYDDWYAGRAGNGPLVPKPGVAQTKRFRRFVDELERTRPPHWLASASAALQVPRDAALALDELQPSMATAARSKGGDLRTNGYTAFVALPPGERWPDALNEIRQLDVLATSEFVCLLRQRGNRLVLKDVLPMDELDRWYPMH